MPKYLIYPISTGIFAVILIATVPKKEIQRLSIYGIIFGGMADVLVHLFGHFTGLFGWINYGPFALKGISIFANVSWSIFFILYYYFLPKKKPLNYIFAGAGIFFSMLYYNFVHDLGILKSYSNSLLFRILFPLIGMTAWFTIATWGFYKLNNFIEGETREEESDLL